MEISQTQPLLKITKLLTTVGYSLCLGSVASFIAMNIIAADSPTIEFLYWQRFFVNPIMNYITIPAIWLFLMGNLGLFLVIKKDRSFWNIVLLVLSFLILINGQFIIHPLATSVSGFAVQQFQTHQVITNFGRDKAMEDICGGINLLFLLSYLAAYIFIIGHAKTNKSKSA